MRHIHKNSQPSSSPPLPALIFLTLNMSRFGDCKGREQEEGGNEKEGERGRRDGPDLVLDEEFKTLSVILGCGSDGQEALRNALLLVPCLLPQINTQHAGMPCTTLGY
jgi:hypothetical protein